MGDERRCLGNRCRRQTQSNAVIRRVFPRAAPFLPSRLNVEPTATAIRWKMIHLLGIEGETRVLHVVGCGCGVDSIVGE